MTANELRQKFLDFMKSKGHVIIPSASLVPENDPSVLFTTAGMHPLVPYLMGEKHPMGVRLTSCQKCIRTGDIDEVGDATHHTFFEMLGNWSLGDYFKKEAIEWSWEFLTDKKYLGLDKNRLAFSVFAGDDDAPFDEEAYGIWADIFVKNGLPVARIAKLPKKNNWWGPAGETGPCGGDTEMFYWSGDSKEVPGSFNDDNDQWVEIWNDVFMEFNKNKESKYEKLTQKNVDTGLGMERVLAALNGFSDNYRTEIFWPIIEKMEEISGRKYEENEKEFRIIADHLKAAVFIIADGIVPSNVQRGYVLRRIIRRAIRQGHILGINKNFTLEIAKVVQKIYSETYPEILKENVFLELEKEENKFRETLKRGLQEFDKVVDNFLSINSKGDFLAINNNGDRLVTSKELPGEIVFNLYATYGFPIELIREIAKEKKIIVDEKGFELELKKHQELSRTASAGMFKGGLADASVETTKLHTAAHLLLAALREVLGGEVFQKGANITAERLRFDFNYSQKLTPEQIKKVEDLVNQKIQEKIEVQMMEMPKDEALKMAKTSFDPAKYGDTVKVYKINDFSIELCGGPHVKNTGELGHFKIAKEESSSAGVRRIKAVLE